MSVALLRWTAVLRARLRRFFRRPQPKLPWPRGLAKYWLDNAAPTGLLRPMTDEESREPPARWQESRISWWEERRRLRGYHIPDDWRF